MSDLPDNPKLDEAEREMEAAEQASTELRLHLQRAKDLVKSARREIAESETRSWSKPGQG